MNGLKFIISIHGMNYTELARKLHVSRQHVNIWALGRMNISEDRLVQLSKLFQLPQKYFQKNLSKKDKIEIYKIMIDKLQKEISNNEEMDKIL